MNHVPAGKALAAVQPLVFFHIPKAGGSTLKEIINRQYPRDTTVWLSFQHAGQMSAFLARSQAERNGLNCLMGHLPFGFHEELHRPSFLFTMLREPVSRFLSEYYYIVRHQLTGPWWPPAENLVSVEAFLDYRIITNAMDVQTRIISGLLPGAGTPPPFEPLPEGALERAKANLRDHFGLVGDTDRFDETMLLLQKRMGWTRGVHYARRNTAPRKTTHKEVAPAVLERIHEHTRKDAELVAYANELLDQALAGVEPGFQEELEALKRRNHRIYLVTGAWKRTPLLRLFSLPGFRQVRRFVAAIVHRFS